MDSFDYECASMCLYHIYDRGMISVEDLEIQRELMSYFE